jgi:poly(A) polymerase
MHKKAKYIVELLHDNGYIAYYAGGWVRDFLLHCASDDIDIATNAPPSVIQSLFSHTVPIGEAFGIILVILDDHQYEVATFRKDIDYKDFRRPTSVEFTTALEDAKRRDFTINGMFYDPLKDEIIDYVEGKKDLEKKIIKAIGNPHERIKEDRLRMLRAVRLSTRFDFSIEEETKKAISQHANELTPYVAIERIYQEFEKMDKYDSLKKALLMLFDFNILQNIFEELVPLERKAVEELLKFLDFFPKKAPLISKLLELFSKKSLSEKISLCQKLKLSNENIDFVKSYHEIMELLSKELSDYEFAHVYADKHFPIILQILGAHEPLFEKKAFLEKHEKKIQSLSFFIERIKNKNPVVKASHLISYEISPGPLMGQLLKEAEKISINEKIKDPETIIKMLKKLPLWPK